VLGGCDKAIPVDFYIPGCPPRPEAILWGAAVAMGLVKGKAQPHYYRQPADEAVAAASNAAAQAEELVKK
jgi:NADH:ubiquinone oxidoreductase subunit B-like Fe-S oxidoreductase